MVGIAGIGAVFIPGTAAGGAPVLLAVALIFAYLALTGQAVTHLKVGENEARFSGTRVVLGVLNDPEIPLASRKRVASTIERSSIARSSDVQRAIEDVSEAAKLSYLYDQNLMTEVHALRRDIGVTLHGLDPVSGTALSVMLDRDRERAFIHTLWVPNSHGAVVGSKAIAEALTFVRTIDLPGMVVTNGRPSSTARDLARALSIPLVSWNEHGEGRQGLAYALDELFPRDEKA